MSAILLIAMPAQADPPAHDAFANAALAPATATVYVHVCHAAKIRRQLASRPASYFLESLLEEGDFQQAWSHLARSVRYDEDELFDLWLGREFTFIKRSGPRGADWALLTAVPATRGRVAVDRLNPRRLPPRLDIPVAEIPEHALRVAAVDERRYLIGPDGHGRLFDVVLERLAKAAPHEAALADDPAFDRARALGPGDVEIFVRHDMAVGGGWSALVGTLDGQRLRLRHTARFEVTPLQRPVTELNVDAAPLSSLQHRCFFSIIEPTDIGGGPAEAFLQAMLGVAVLSEDMRKNLGERQIFTFGEIKTDAAGDQQHAEGEFNTFLPTAAVAIELEDPRWAEAELDAHLVEVARAIAALGAEDYTLKVPPARRFVPGRPRQIDLAPALRRFAGEKLPADAVSLNWTVASGPYGDFYVVATHPQQLADTVAALETQRGAPAEVDRWTQCGALDGRRLSLHLSGYAEGRSAFGAAGGEQGEEVRHTMRLLSELAEGIDACRWRLRRPNDRDLELEVDIILSPPESVDRSNAASAAYQRRKDAAGGGQ